VQAGEVELIGTEGKEEKEAKNKGQNAEPCIPRLPFIVQHSTFNLLTAQ
jgi:hypothetical protein